MIQKNNIFCSNCKNENKNFKIICFCGNQLIEINNKFPCNLCNRIYFINLIKCSCYEKNIFNANFINFEISNSNDFITSIAYKFPNKFLTGHESGKIFYFELENKKILKIFNDHNKRIFDIKIFYDDFISFSDDKKIIIKDFEKTIFSYKNDYEFECVDLYENFILICDKKNKIIFIKFENEKFYVKKIEIYSKFLIFLNKIEYGIFFVNYYNSNKKLELFEIQNEKFVFVKKFENNFNIKFIKEFSIGKFFTFSINNNNNYFNLNLWKITENNFINEFIFYQTFFDLFFLYDYFNINNFLILKENKIEIFEQNLKNKISEFNSNENKKIIILKDNKNYNLAGINKKNNIVYFYNFFNN